METRTDTVVPAGPGEGKPDPEGRVRRPADHLLGPGGEAEEDHGGQPGAGVPLDGREGPGGQQAERREREGQQVRRKDRPRAPPQPLTLCVCVWQAQTGQAAEGARRRCQRAAARRPVSLMMEAQLAARGRRLTHSLCCQGRRHRGSGRGRRERRRRAVTQQTSEQNLQVRHTHAPPWLLIGASPGSSWLQQ